MAELAPRWWAWPALGLAQEDANHDGNVTDTVDEASSGHGRDIGAPEQRARGHSGDVHSALEDEGADAANIEDEGLVAGGLEDMEGESKTPFEQAIDSRENTLTEGAAKEGRGQQKEGEQPRERQENVTELEWQIQVIMAQHAEDMKRMTPRDAALFAKQVPRCAAVNHRATQSAVKCRIGSAPQA